MHTAPQRTSGECSLCHALLPARRYRSYTATVTELQRLVKQRPDLAKLWSTQERYGLQTAGVCEAMLTRASRGLRTERTGYAHQPPARCAYLRRRAACPRASLSCVRRARWHARDRYRGGGGGPGRRRAPVPRPIIVPAALVRGRMAHVCESAISASAKPTYTEA